jgi:isopentenyl-diphosphate delta-isomerase
MQQEYLILVDETDRPIGKMEKLEAHEKGLLHRAFSVFLFNDQNEVLLHQRAAAKYHSPNNWTNTCCSHPREGESVTDAGMRRLREEMGIACALSPLFSFIYKAAFDNGLTEHEFDHVLVGRFNGEAKPNPEEVQATQWMSLEKLKQEINDNPTKFTPWLKIIINDYFDKFSSWPE